MKGNIPAWVGIVWSAFFLAVAWIPVVLANRGWFK